MIVIVLLHVIAILSCRLLYVCLTDLINVLEASVSLQLRQPIFPANCTFKLSAQFIPPLEIPNKARSIYSVSRIVKRSQPISNCSRLRLINAILFAPTRSSHPSLGFFLPYKFIRSVKHIHIIFCHR